MPTNDLQRRDDLIIAAALARFSYYIEGVDPELGEEAWQLGADRLVDYDLEPMDAVDELEIGE
ncbi:hypothetical protein [Natronolimnobius baerhuensis]|uniref:Uncharacterized protein n=1 Tax=Natronolimnobius baerhuensis TaxID=253108 RepID=A0A202E4H5_9EURY|nr:hypothetical protein [Natronolimnobius baerhuensis]OVE83185.1 hypothetical protein B2G88_17405 [Natronolimnobius baerhuensis]